MFWLSPICNSIFLNLQFLHQLILTIYKILSVQNSFHSVFVFFDKFLHYNDPKKTHVNVTKGFLGKKIYKICHILRESGHINILHSWR